MFRILKGLLRRVYELLQQGHHGHAPWYCVVVLDPGIAGGAQRSELDPPAVEELRDDYFKLARLQAA